MTSARPARRLLVISYSFPPALNARAFRWGALAAHFAGAGWDVEVVTSGFAGGAPVVDRPGLRVHRADWRWVGRLRGSLRRERGQSDGAGSGTPARRCGAVRWLRDHVWARLWWPDSSFLWCWPARQVALRLARQRPFDVVVSVSPTFTAVLVGAALRRARGARRWIIDYGDPFSLQEAASPNNTALFGGLNRRVERRLLGIAQAVCVTTEETGGRYAGAFPEIAARLHVIPPLLSLAPVPDEAPTFERDGTIRLVFIGTLYRGLREPDFLFELLAALLSQAPPMPVELHFFGDSHQVSADIEAWRPRLGSALRVHGMVSREVVAAAMRDADVLVNIGNATRDQLPSKLVEYVASGRPILNLGSGPSDLSTRFLEGYPEVLTLQARGRPDGAQLGHVRGFLQDLPRRVAPETLDAWLMPYRLPAIAARYEKVIG